MLDGFAQHSVDHLVSGWQPLRCTKGFIGLQQTEHARAVWDRVAAAGEEFGIVPVGAGVYGTTGRLEKGYRLMGSELDGEYTVVEAGLARPKVKSADFIGKAAYLKHREEEPAAVLCTLTVDDHTSRRDGIPRYMVGGETVTTLDGSRIVDRKESHGHVFLVTDGGLHHQLAASGNFGTVVRRNYPVAIATRFDAAPEDEASIVGCLCTPLDRLADQAHLPRADVGDLVAVFCAGAYGASASPSGFLGQGPAREMLV